MNKKELLISEVLLTDEQLKAIGCLAVESSRLESLLDEIIETTCLLDNTQKELFIGKWLTGMKLDAIKTLVPLKLRSEIKKKKFATIFENLKDLIARRNIIMHGPWSVPNPYKELPPISEIPLQSTATAKSKKKNITVKADDIMTVALRLSEWHMELFRFYYKNIVLERKRASLNRSLRQYRNQFRTEKV